jgi:hypothetical protein
VKTLREFTDPISAGIVQSFLRDNGINAVLFDEEASAWTAGRLLVPVCLAVPPDQVDATHNLLKQFEGKGKMIVDKLDEPTPPFEGEILG